MASCNTDKRKFLLPQAEVVIEKTDGSSVKLAMGENVIKVNVSNKTYVDTYTVTVTRS